MRRCRFNRWNTRDNNEFARKDSRIKVINSDIKSYGYQMNLGIRYAKGEYIGIVETDDFIDREMYQMLYNIIVQMMLILLKAVIENLWNKTEEL